MALLRKVDTFTNDVIPPVFYLSYKGRTFRIEDQRYPIAYGYGISTSYTLQSEVSLDFWLNQLAIVRTDGVPAACILYDESFQP